MNEHKWPGSWFYFPSENSISSGTGLASPWGRNRTKSSPYWINSPSSYFTTLPTTAQSLAPGLAWRRAPPAQSPTQLPAAQHLLVPCWGVGACIDREGRAPPIELLPPFLQHHTPSPTLGHWFGVNSKRRVPSNERPTTLMPHLGFAYRSPLPSTDLAPPCLGCES